jgi:REP element-mobilizing transposase RayT
VKAHSKQLALPLPPAKPSHGGRRAGAGRPNRSGLRAHLRRPRLNPREPVHVTIKLREGLPSLRKKEVFRMLRASVKMARGKGLCVAHFAILSNHIHFILEPRGAELREAFQSLCISFAKKLNAHLGRHGAVFKGRYHLHVLKTPTEVRSALAYVLTNEAMHRANARIFNKRKLDVRIDPYSSAHAFLGWKKLLGSRVEFSFSGWSEDVIEAWLEEILLPARTWLLREGWVKSKT